MDNTIRIKAVMNTVKRPAPIETIYLFFKEVRVFSTTEYPVMAVLNPISHGTKLTALNIGMMVARNIKMIRVPPAPIRTAEIICRSQINFWFSNRSQFSIKSMALFIVVSIPFGRSKQCATNYSDVLYDFPVEVWVLIFTFKLVGYGDI